MKQIILISKMNRFYFVVLLLSFIQIFNSCKKNNESKPVTNQDNYSPYYYYDENPATTVEPRIKMYINELNGVGNGTYDTLEIDSSLFYLEAALNYQYGDFGIQLDSIYEFSQQYSLVMYQGNSVLSDDAKNTYDEMASYVESIYDAASGANKTIAAVQVQEDPYSNTDPMTIIVTVLLKKGSFLNEEVGALTYTGDYFWDLNSGFCSGGGSDGAAHQLEFLGNYNMNLTQLAPQSGHRLYLTNLTYTTRNVQNTATNFNNPYASSGAILPYDIWAYENTVSSPGPCIPQEIGDYYLGLIPNVISTYRPSTYTFVNLIVNDGGEVSTPAPEYLHFYRIKYGKLNTTTDNTIF